MSHGLQQLINQIYFFESKLLMYHWNVTGKDFLSYHKILEESYKEMAEHKDLLAEHLRYERVGVVLDFNSVSQMGANFTLPGTASEMLQDALSGYKSLISEYDKLEKDIVLDAIVSDIVKELEKRVYFMQSILLSTTDSPNNN
jgi:DNA-binding ferritin-like protein